MTESDIRLVLQATLQALVGLQLSIARDAASMKVFHFGDIRPHISGRGTVGEYALHIQCPWRIVCDDGVVTGASDRFVPPCEEADVDDEDARSGNLQLVRIAALLKGYDSSTKSHVNSINELVVTSVTSDRYGGAELLLSGGYRLQIFPDGSQEEDWRFVDVKGRHVVIEKGQASIME